MQTIPNKKWTRGASVPLVQENEAQEDKIEQEIDLTWEDLLKTELEKRKDWSVLKAQSHAKISQWCQDWRKREDLLTADYFGVLDYLPRTFLADFIEHVKRLNPRIDIPTNEVNWSKSELIFWPRERANEHATEPDLVVATEKWIVVVEVKLESSLGSRQPWREILAGRSIATQRGVPAQSVFHLLLTRNQEYPDRTFQEEDQAHLPDFRRVSMQMRWFEAFALVRKWLTHGLQGQAVAPEQTRLLSDLASGMRKRSGLAFSGFRLQDLPTVIANFGPKLCTTRFTGFWKKCRDFSTISKFFMRHKEFKGFLLNVRDLVVPDNLAKRVFDGFGLRSETVGVVESGYFCSTEFSGFFNNVQPCKAGRAWRSTARK